jgi:hypothetical protein
LVLLRKLSSKVQTLIPSLAIKSRLVTVYVLFRRFSGVDFPAQIYRPRCQHPWNPEKKKKKKTPELPFMLADDN